MKPNISYILLVFVIFLFIAFIPIKEYVEFDKTVTFANKTYFVYKIVKDNLIIDIIDKKFICPERIQNTTCIVSSNAIICERFTCIEYNGMISNKVYK